MADELLPNEGEQIVGEAPIVDEPQVTKTVEDFARERGWKPQDEYSGEDWRDAESFLSFGMDRNRDLIKSLRTVEDRVERISRTSAQIAQDAADKARREERTRWEGIQREATEQGDYRVVADATAKIAELANPAPVDRTQHDPLVERFIGENTWFNSDPAAQAVAVAVTGQIAARGGSIPEQLAAAKEAVHKRFPEYAPAPSKSAPVVNQPGTRLAAPSSRAKTAGDLPAEAREAMKALIAKGFTTEQGYVAHYFDNRKGTV